MRAVEPDSLGAWRECLGLFAPEQRDVYFSPEYHALSDEGTADGFVHRRGEHALLVPGVRVAIPGTDLFDLQTPNGYGGPLLTAKAPAEFRAEAWEAWTRHAARERIVAAFFKLHPLIDFAPALPLTTVTRVERSTVVLSLDGGRESLWRDADGRHRNMVSRGDREGMTARWNDEDDWNEMPALYARAMQRLHADERLRFDATYFARLHAMGDAELIASRDARGIVAAHVFLWGEVFGHYHLAARRDDAPNYAMNWLMQRGIERAYERGLRALHLGGGASARPDDGVLRFKRSLGGELRDFHVARVVADPAAFDELLAARAARAPGAVAPTWLLGYRQPARPPDPA